MIALLAFLLGVWLWDHHFGETSGYAPGTEQAAMIKFDRDLRLADAMAADPPWLRWLAGVRKPAEARAQALDGFRKLAMEQPVSEAGLEAFLIIMAVDEGVPVVEALKEPTRTETIDRLPEYAGQLGRRGGKWWHARLLESWESNAPAASDWRTAYGMVEARLRTRAIGVGSSIWLTGLAGFAFVPSMLRRLRRGLRARDRGYAAAWPPSLGLIVFLSATLAWIGFSLILEIGIYSLPTLPPLLGISLDVGARLLPALIAIGLLFRRPSHAARVMGLRKPLHPGMILGIFSLLMLADQGLRWAFGTGAPSNPAGGLHLGDAGLWGLVFVIVSACVAAPIAEEIVYRGVLFRSLANRLGVLPSAALSSAIFAIVHFYGGYGLASVALFGFSSALFYAATGSLTAAIGLHMLYNASIKIPDWLIYHAPVG